MQNKMAFIQILVIPRLVLLIHTVQAIKKNLRTTVFGNYYTANCDKNINSSSAI